MDRLLVLRLLGGDEEPAPYSRFRELQQQLQQLPPVQGAAAAIVAVCCDVYTAEDQ